MTKSSEKDRLAREQRLQNLLEKISDPIAKEIDWSPLASGWRLSYR